MEQRSNAEPNADDEATKGLDSLDGDDAAHRAAYADDDTAVTDEEPVDEEEINPEASTYGAP